MAEKPDKPKEPTSPIQALPSVGEKAEDRLHPLLSNAEVLEARAEARKTLEKEQRAAAKKALIAEETKRLRFEEGLVVGGIADEPVQITIMLAEHSDKITINSRQYWHGMTYTVPRHVANTLAEIMARGEVHQNQVDGKSLTKFYERQRVTKVSPIKGISNAPQAIA